MATPRLPARSAARWAALATALSLVWLVAPGGVPLYDGVGFPDEPYRFVPVRDTKLPAATSARITLRLEGGLNPGGLVANSAERGPQVSFFAPPQAFRAPTDAAELVAAAVPVQPERPAPPGTAVSNTYLLTFTAGQTAASLNPAAQAPAISLRATAVEPPLPVFVYRATPAEPWRTLATQRVGTDIFTTKAPGAGEFALASIPRPPSQQSASKGPLLLVIGLGVVLVAGALVAVRVAGQRRS